MKQFVMILSIGTVVLSAAWLITQPGYEPAITLIVGIAGVMGSRFSRGRDTKASESNTALLRPHRLDARNVLLAFTDFCLKYRTLHPQKAPGRTRDLSTEIGTFKSKLDSFGPLSMPELTGLQSDIVAHAWNLQRLLNRQGGPDPRPINLEFETLEDNLDGIEDWFARVKKRIKAEIDPYLEM